MKKILVVLFAVMMLMVSCSENNGVDDIDEYNQNSEIVETQKTDETDASYGENLDALGNEIKSRLAEMSDEYRQEFLTFWYLTELDCRGISYDLSKSDNTEFFEFDPTDESQIPEKLKETCDFSGFAINNRRGLFSDFHMSIDGEDVTLLVDGMKVYPSDYDYETIQEIIDSLK